MAYAKKVDSPLSRSEQDIARRWCVLNARGWPPDLTMPSAAERFDTAMRLMAKCVRYIGMTKCLAYWNSDAFQSQDIRRAF